MDRKNHPLHGDLGRRVRRRRVRCGLIAALLAAVLCALPTACKRGPRFTSQLSIERIERLSQLVTLKVQVADVLQAESGSVTGAWLVKGDALISVDLSKAEIAAQDPEHRTATILLPQPQVLQPRVDHRRTVTFDVRTGWFTPSRIESRLRDDAMRQAQALVEAAVDSEENIGLARDTAEKWLRVFFEQLGWRVSISWKSRNTTS